MIISQSLAMMIYTPSVLYVIHLFLRSPLTHSQPRTTDLADFTNLRSYLEQRNVKVNSDEHGGMAAFSPSRHD